MLTFDPRSWIAQVEGKKYYLLNLDEEEMAAKAVSRILAYGPASGAAVEGAEEIEDETEETEEV
jgi:hypothetical protein